MSEFSLADVGCMLVGLKQGAGDDAARRALSKSKTAMATYNRLSTMMKKTNAEFPAQLYTSNISGGYDVDTWISDGLLPGGGKDPGFHISSDHTRKKHYTTLVSIGTLGKRCHAFAESVPRQGVDHFRKKLSDISLGLRPASNEHRPAALSWADIVNAYHNTELMKDISERSPCGALVIHYLLAGGKEFPPAKRRMGNVRVLKSCRNIDAQEDTLCFHGNEATLRIRGKPPEQMPVSLASIIRKNLDSGRRWRKWLFQCGGETHRPASQNTFEHRIRSAMNLLVGCPIGINTLVKLYNEHHILERDMSH